MKLLNTRPDHFLCHYTFVVDTYGEMCSFGCDYCYAKNSKRENLNISYIDKLFYETFELGKRSGIREILSKRIPLRIGYERDPFQENEKEMSITKSLIKSLNKYNYPFILITKSTLLLENDYLELIQNGNCYVQISLSAYDNCLLKKIEPKAPCAEDRLSAISKLSASQIDCSLRLNILPNEILKEHSVCESEYISQIKKIISLCASSKIILNPIQLSTENINESLYEKYWEELSEWTLKEGKKLSFCYLGGSFKNKVINDLGGESNCCQCMLSEADMLNSMSLLSYFRTYSLLQFLPKYFMGSFYKMVNKLLEGMKK